MSALERIPSKEALGDVQVGASNFARQGEGNRYQHAIV